MSGICPCCGYNLSADTVIETGEWLLDPRGSARWRGREVVTRRSWVVVLHSLAREEGRWISPMALQARISESDNANLFSSVMSQLRRYLAEQGVPFPAQSDGQGKSSKGWRWAA